MADLSEISEVLRLLGVGGNYSGQRLTAAAVLLTIGEQRPDRCGNLDRIDGLRYAPEQVIEAT